MPVCRGRRGAALSLRWFDDGAVVFDEATGSLHALEPAAAMALQHCLSGAEWSAQSLARTMSEVHGLAVDIETAQAWLAAFAALNFVVCRL
jgi:PqqD family protein of HPr-rel-A system